jgi:precorrin-2 dehydrogenase/sirohydrochlorin ferrochelatase
VSADESNRPRTPLYPLFLKLKGRRVLLVGGGEVAFRKARALWESAPDLTVVAKRFSSPFREWMQDKALTPEERPYRDNEAASYFLVVSATDDPRVNRRVYEDACSAERLVNVVDQPHLCNFFVPSVLKRGALQVAVSTSGAFPALSRRIRKELDESLPAQYGPLLDRISPLRRKWKQELATPALRKQALEELLASDAVKRFLEKDEAPLEQKLRELLPPGS